MAVKKSKRGVKMLQNKRVRSSIPIQYALVFGGGILIGILLMIAASVLAILLSSWPGSMFILYFTKAPVYMLVGVVGAGIWAVLRSTTVFLEDGRLIIWRLWKREVLPRECEIAIYKKEKVRIESALKIIFVQWHMEVTSEDGTVKDYRLYEFSEKQAFKLEGMVREYFKEQVPAGEGYYYDNAELVFSIPKEQIILRERKALTMNTLIVLGLTVLMGALMWWGTEPENQLLTLIVMAACLIMLLLTPLKIIKLAKNSKRCPREISFLGEHITVDGKHFSASTLERVEVTAPSSRSFSIYYLQRYVTFFNHQGKETYWMGSDQSGFTGDYIAFCQALNGILAHHPEKLRYVGGESVMEK